MKRFLKRICRHKDDNGRICGPKNENGADDTLTHLLDFFEITKEKTIKIEGFCAKFVNKDGYAKNPKVEELLAVMFKSFRNYRNKKPADPEITNQLTRILREIHQKAEAKEVRVRACVRVYVRVYVRACACVCVCVRVLVCDRVSM